VLSNEISTPSFCWWRLLRQTPFFFCCQMRSYVFKIFFDACMGMGWTHLGEPGSVR
jgi:hypothetical protein